MRYASIRNLDVSNGKEIGVSLFVQGCPFRCYNCFNSETWNFNGGKEWTIEVENEFIKLANRPYIQRVSILGGEPLTESNLPTIQNLVNKIRLLLPEKTIWLYTGYTLQECLNHPQRADIVNKCDIIVDGRYVDELKDITLKWRGSSNQHIWQNKNGIWTDVTDTI